MAVAVAESSLYEAFPWQDTGRRALPLLVAKFTTLAMTVACFALVARHLGPERFGFYSLAYGLPWLLLPVVDFGISPVVAREISAGGPIGWAVAGVHLTMRMFPLAVAASVVGGWALGLRGREAWLLVAPASQLAAFTLRPVEAVLIAEKRTDALAACSVLANALSLGGVLLGTSFNLKDPWILAIHAGYANVYYVLILALIAPRLTAEGRPSAAQLWHEAWAFGLGGVASSVTERAGIPLVVWLLGPVAAGLYSAGYRLYEGGLGAAGTVAVIARPFLGESLKTPLILARRAGDFVRGAMAVSGMVGLWIAGAAPVVMEALFGSAFRGAGPVLVALAPAIANILPGTALAEVAIAVRHRRDFLVAACGAAIVSVGGTVVLSRVLGLVGPALAVGLGGMAALGWLASSLQRSAASSLGAAYWELCSVWWVLFGLTVAGDTTLPGVLGAAGGVGAGLLYAKWAMVRRRGP